jgi:hypothetical protein
VRDRLKWADPSLFFLLFKAPGVFFVINKNMRLRRELSIEQASVQEQVGRRDISGQVEEYAARQVGISAGRHFSDILVT